MMSDMEHVEHLLHLELVHRVHFALIRHAIPRLKSCQSGFLGRTFAIRNIFLKATAIPRNSTANRPQGAVPAKWSIVQPTSAPPPIPPSSSARTRLPSRSEEPTSELQSLMRISSAVFCSKKKKEQ